MSICYLIYSLQKKVYSRTYSYVIIEVVKYYSNNAYYIIMLFTISTFALIKILDNLAQLTIDKTNNFTKDTEQQIR